MSQYPASVLLGLLFVLLVAMISMSSYFYSLTKIMAQHLTEIEYALCTTLYDCSNTNRRIH